MQAIIKDLKGLAGSPLISAQEGRVHQQTCPNKIRSGIPACSIGTGSGERDGGLSVYAKHPGTPTKAALGRLLARVGDTVRGYLVRRVVRWAVHSSRVY